MSLKLGLGLGVNSGGGVPADYALEFNGTDEYLQIALPNDELLASTAGDANEFIQKTISGLVIGQKYKLKLRYQSADSFVISDGTTPYFTLQASADWNTVSKIFTATSTVIKITSAGVWVLDYASVKHEQGFDLNKDQEMILHSKNWDFERTLGTELASGTVTIGSKYVVTAGTVEGNAVGTEFLAVTNATTLDASNKVKPIPNLATATFINKSGASFDTFTGASATGFTAVEDTTLSRAVAYQTFGFQSGKRYRFSYTITVNSFSFGVGLFIGDANVGTQQIVHHAATGTSTVTYDVTANANHGYYGFRVEAGQTADFVVSGFHFYEIPEWTASGNHTGDVSIIDKSGTGATNTQSLKITASGAGNTSNCVTLPSANLESCVATKKYTLQGEARLDPTSLTYGSELVTSIQNSATLPYETFTTSGSDISSAINSSGEGWAFIDSISNCNPNEIYKIEFTLTLNSGTVPLFRLMINGSGSGGSSNIVTSAIGSNTLYLIPTGTVTNVDLSIYVQSATNFSITGLSVKKATPITLTAQLGTKSVTSSALSIVAGTFTKFVLNFEATASEVNQDLKLYLSGAGSVFVDKLSLTQAYDAQTYLKILPTETAKRTVYNIDANNFLEFRADGKIGVSVSDGTNTITNIAEVAYTPNEWIELLIELNRTGNVKIIKGTGTPTGTAITTVGKIIKTSTTSGFRIGANASAGETFKGQIAKIVRTLYDNLTGLTGASENLKVTFQDGSTIVSCLKDYSPKAHTVSGANVDITNRKRVVR